MDDKQKFHAGFWFENRREAVRFVKGVEDLERAGGLVVHDYLIVHPPRENGSLDPDGFHDGDPGGNAILGALLGAAAGAFVGVALGANGFLSNAVGISAIVGAIVGASLGWLIARFAGMSPARVAVIRAAHRNGTTVAFLVSNVDDSMVRTAFAEHPAARPLLEGNDSAVAEFVAGSSGHVSAASSS